MNSRRTTASTPVPVKKTAPAQQPKKKKVEARPQQKSKVAVKATLPPKKRAVSKANTTSLSSGSMIPHGMPLRANPAMKHTPERIQSNLKRKSPWYSSLMDPLHGADCKIPDATGVQTGTLQTVYRGSFSINGSGVGGVHFNNLLPFGGAGSNGAYFDSAASNALSITWDPVNTITFESNATLNSFSSGVRVVSAALYLASEASLANNGGVMIGYTLPWDSYGGVTVINTAQNSYKSAIIPVNNNRPTVVRYFPIDMSTHDAGSLVPCTYSTFWEPGNTDNPQWEIGCLCTGCTPNATFEVIMCVNYEYVPITNAMNILDSSPSPQDAMETDLVENWVQSMPIVQMTSSKQVSSSPSVVQPQHGEEQTGFGMFADVVKEILPFAMTALSFL